MRGDNQIWTGDQGVADPRLTTWLCRHQLLYYIISEIIRQDINDSYGNRTRVTAVKGRCLNRLTTEPYLSSFINKTPRVGLEPTTARLTAACSTNWAIEEYTCVSTYVNEGLFLQNCTLNLSSIRTTSVITLFVLSCFEFSFSLLSLQT